MKTCNGHVHTVINFVAVYGGNQADSEFARYRTLTKTPRAGLMKTDLNFEVNKSLWGGSAF